eukprot:g24399.t1
MRKRNQSPSQSRFLKKGREIKHSLHFRFLTILSVPLTAHEARRRKEVTVELRYEKATIRQIRTTSTSSEPGHARHQEKKQHTKAAVRNGIDKKALLTLVSLTILSRSSVSEMYGRVGQEGKA